MMNDFIIDCFLPIVIVILVIIVIILGIYAILLTTGTWVIDEELQQRIDEAIEYIEDNFYEVGGEVGGSDLPYQPIQDLLDILRGTNE